MNKEILETLNKAHHKLADIQLSAFNMVEGNQDLDHKENTLKIERVSMEDLDGAIQEFQWISLYIAMTDKKYNKEENISHVKDDEWEALLDKVKEVRSLERIAMGLEISYEAHQYADRVTIDIDINLKL